MLFEKLRYDDAVDVLSLLSSLSMKFYGYHFRSSDCWTEEGSSLSKGDTVNFLFLFLFSLIPFHCI